MGPSGPKLQRESENEFPGPLGPKVQKVQNGVEKESKDFAGDFPGEFLGAILGSSKGGGKAYRVSLGGGKRTAECALQNHFWRPEKLGLVWSVPLSSKGNDRESPKKGGGKTYRRWGGSKNVFGEGFFAEFTVCFPPP